LGDDVDRLHVKRMNYSWFHTYIVIVDSSEASWSAQGSGGKGRVSFDTNMLMDEEISDGGLVERFHMKKFSDNPGSKAKCAILKVTGSWSSKK
jgi:hypothetical protein